jgi:hypothetical protein
LDEAAPGAAETAAESTPAADEAGEGEEHAYREESGGQAHEEPARFRETPPEPHSAEQPRRGAPASVTEAIEEVNRIIETLKETLDDMEEVLETLELAERQKNADEHEIETLRRSLQHMRRPREEQRRPPSGHHSEGH